jgi:hypothetical protein
MDSRLTETTRQEDVRDAFYRLLVLGEESHLVRAVRKFALYSSTKPPIFMWRAKTMLEELPRSELTDTLPKILESQTKNLLLILLKQMCVVMRYPADSYADASLTLMRWTVEFFGRLLDEDEPLLLRFRRLVRAMSVAYRLEALEAGCLAPAFQQLKRMTLLIRINDLPEMSSEDR